MKNIKYITLLLLMMFAVSISLSAKQQQEFIKTINKNYKVNQKTILQIKNKYGNVNIKNWQKNEVKIVVTIKVTAKKQEKADKIFKRINIEFNKDTNLISAVTNIDSDNGFIKVVYININDKTTSYTINYDVYVPVYLKLDLTNKFGNVFINELHGKCDIYVKYGSLKANNLLFPDYKPYSKIKISYGDVKIDKISWCNIVSKYSELNITNSKALFIYGRYSEYVLENNIAVICDSKYDDYKINKTENFVLTGAYNDVKINTLTKQFVIDSKYGDFKIKHIVKDFTKIRIQSSYSNLYIGLSSESDFQLKIQGKYIDIDMPHDILKISEICDEKININKKYNNENTKNKLFINSDYSDIKIKFTDN